MRRGAKPWRQAAALATLGARAPVDHWPLFGLRVRTPRLELRYPDDDLADIELVGLEPCLPFFGAVEAEWLVP